LVENIRIQPRPAEAFATSQGRSIGDAGILSMASWRGVGLADKADFTVSPAQPQVNLDYPLVTWADSQVTPAQQQVAAAFGDFLLSEAQQNSLTTFFLERASAAPAGVQADGAAVLALQRWAERELR
jgi:hypothetical protein